MIPLRFVSLSILATVTLVTATAQGQEEPEAQHDPWRARPLALLGETTPTGGPRGVLSAAVDVAVVGPVSLSAGAGVGLAGTQLSGDARLRVLTLSRTVRLAIGGGISAGPYTNWTDGGLAPHRDHARFAWLVYANAELSLDVRLDGGFTVRPFVGVGALLHHTTVRCTAGSDAGPQVPCATADVSEEWKADRPPATFPYFGVSMGYAFTL